MLFMRRRKIARQSEEEFFCACNLQREGNARATAKAVRSTIANLRGISPDEIVATHEFEDLGWTPFWRKCGDAGFESDRLVQELQSQLGCRLAESQLRKIRDPDLHVSMTIAQFVQDVWSVMKAKGENNAV